MATTTDPLNALLYIRDNNFTARWNFPDAVGSLVSSPSGIGNAAALTYSFLSSVPSYYSSTPIAGFMPLSALQQQATKDVLASIANVIHLSFTEMTGVGTMTFGMNVQTGSGGYASPPSYFYSYSPLDGKIASVTVDEKSGDVWLNSSRIWTASDFALGGYGYGTLVHEIGHSLGLKHPFAAVSATGYILDASLDSTKYTVMSYTPHPYAFYRTVTPTSSGYSSHYENIYPETLMPLDITALQYLYGANTSFNTGNNTYTFDPLRPFIKTIWDGGGNDTISVANFTLGSLIDLREGYYSSIRILSDALPLGAVESNTGIYDGTDNLAIAYGTVIENAIGGSGNDTLIGNSIANNLSGGGGDDTLNGGGGNDITDGGIGTDTAVYGAWLNYTVTGTATSATVTALTGTDGTDTLSSVENLTFNGVAVTTAAAVNDAPVGLSDNNASDAVIEAAIGVVGDSSAVGNVLNNDTDADSALGLGETKAVKTVNNLTTNVGNAVVGVYGSLLLLANGGYTYTLDNANAATNALSTGQIVTDNFTYTVVDAHGAISAPTTLAISITGSNDTLIVNNPPTLTNFSAVVASGNEGSAITVTFANLQAQGNEADTDGTVTAFVIKTVSTGTLKIGIDLASATAWSVVNNNVDASHQAYWTPDLNANGTLNAFRVTAKDNGGMESITPVQATVTITGINHAPTLTTPATLNYIDTVFVDSFTTKTGVLVGSDIDVGATLSYGITGGVDNLNGTVSKSTVYGTLTVITATGAYSFVPLASAIEPLAANVTDSTLTVTVSDGTLSANKIFTVTISQSGTTETIGNDILIGGVGANSWAGLAGNDTYYVDVAGDSITEAVNGGADIVYSTAADYTLADNIEALVVWGAGVNGSGNGDINYLFGNALNNILDGKGGADGMVGGAGNDIYLVDNVGDVITENLNNGFDIIHSSVSYTLTANVEMLTLTGALGTEALNGNGNNDNNYLFGNAGNNVLDGKAGADVMVGKAGDDTYYVDNANDVILENTNNGTDTVISSISYGLLALSLADATLVAGANAENLTITGTALFAFGNDLNNKLTGNSNNNVIAGGAGLDTLTGGVGNDAYYVDIAGDVVVEKVGEGFDIVYSTAADYTLGDYSEVLVVWGAGLNGTGNAQDNYVFGNTYGGSAINNSLSGGAGNDILMGFDGADTYNGGTGQDTYNLTEQVAATDSIQIVAGDSLATVGLFDKVVGFTLGTSISHNAGVDRLDLVSTIITANTTTFNGTDAGAIQTSSITNGIIRFQGAGGLTIAASALSLSDALTYLQINITNGSTVAFAAASDTYVFQDGGIGVNDTVVDLVGVIATSMNNTGLGAGAVWLI